MGLFVFKVLGLPPKELIQTARKRKKFFGEFLNPGAVTLHRTI